jgi:hypothetical protein
MYGGPAKVLLPYKSFMVNQYSFMLKLLMNSTRNPAALTRFIGLSYMLGGEQSNPLNHMAYMALDEALKRGYGKSIQDIHATVGGERIPLGMLLKNGAPATAGVDLSGAMAMQNPLRWIANPMEASSRFTKAGQDLFRWMVQKEKYADLDFLESIKPRIVTKVGKAMDVAAHGMYESRKQSALTEVPRWKAPMMVTGIVPTEVTQAYQRIEDKQRVKTYEDGIERRFDKWADYVYDERKDKAAQVIKEVHEEKDSLYEKIVGAKEGRYKDELIAKYVKVQSKLENRATYLEAMKRKTVPADYREGDRTHRWFMLMERLRDEGAK